MRRLRSSQGRLRVVNRRLLERAYTEYVAAALRTFRPHSCCIGRNSASLRPREATMIYVMCPDNDTPLWVASASSTVWSNS
jgi:hypothetical protein